MSNYVNIPDELKQLKQWVVWKYEDVGAAKPTKVPYNKNGYPASVTNPDDWMTFDEACRLSANHSGIGFVFTKFDPYAFIDLDDTEGNEANLERQKRIAKEFNSYAEKSPSGKGLHIIVKGMLPQGRRRSHIEIYSSERYATFTGDVFNNAPINEYHALL